jgi:hypothetical protein
MKQRERHFLDSRYGKYIVLFSKMSYRPTLAHPYSYSEGVKRPGYAADHSSPPSAEVRNVWSCTSVLPHANIGV